MKKRIGKLDIAKGFALILIIFFHCANSDSYLKILAGGFHLPLFFVVSGMIYGISGRKVTFRNKALKFVALYVIVELLMLIAIGRLFDRKAIVNFVTTKGNSPVWYLPCYIVVLILFVIIEHWCAERDLSILIYMLIGMIAVFWPFKEPILILRSCVGIIFFVTGYYLHDTILKIRSWYIIILETVMYIIFTLMNGKVDLWNMALSNQLLYFFNAFIGVHVCIQVSSVLDSLVKLERIKTCISFFGQYSLWILCTHWILIGVAFGVENIIFGQRLDDGVSRLVYEFVGVSRFIFVLILYFLAISCYFAIKKRRKKHNPYKYEE